MATETETQTGSGESETMTISGVTLGTVEGGEMILDGEKPMEAPGGIELTKTGAQFGPLEISPYPDSTARIGGLTFLEVRSFIDSLFGSGAGGGLFGTLAVSASVDRRRQDGDDNNISRRDLLKTLGAGAAVAGATGTAAATTTETDFQRAQFEAQKNPEGLRIRVFDREDGYLPVDRTYYTFVNGQSYGRFAPATDTGYGDVLPTKTGTVTVGPEGSGSFLEALRADKTVTYDGISLAKSTTDAQTGEEIVLSTNDLIVEAAQQASGSGTTLTLNGTSIPHQNESIEDSVGYYGISDDRLVYTTGRQPPAATSARFTIYPGRVDELLDDISRGV